jgi:formate C-acetyltransferase
MNDRIKRLRAESLDTRPWISAERAMLMTEFHESAPPLSPPMRRALAFRHLLERKAIYIGDGELIVGERGPSPKGTPTYPELCCHTLEDLDILDSRDRTSYRVCDEARAAYADRVIPFWQGRSMRDALFSQMDDAWKDAYDAGVFTEFMEQRAPGHTVLDGKIYERGFVDFKRDIRGALDRLDFMNDPRAYDKREELRAMDVCSDAIILFAERHAALAHQMAGVEPDPARRDELLRIAGVCSWVPAHAPRTFHEALQAYWFVHLGVITELNTWDSFNPGHLDQHLYPFYARGLADGSLTEADARELLECFWIKFNNQPAPPKVGVTAAESGTYTDFANINSGGLRPDGSDGVNDLTYLILDVIDEMRLLQPSSNIQLSRKSPDRFLLRACEIIRKGWGQPSIFNADTVVEELLRQGKSLADARAGGTSGCVETGAFGKEAYILTGYFNLPKVLELALNDGVDPLTGKRLGPSTGSLDTFTSFDAVMDAFRRQLQFFADVKVKGANIIERLYATTMPAPFLSIIIDDCIAKGMDYNAGGARYNTTYMMPVGIATVVDSLSAIRTHVFEQHAVAVSRLGAALKQDFASDEPLRQLLWNKTSRYGNDDDAADGLLTEVFDAMYDALEGKPNTRGGQFHVNYLSTTCHVYFGSKVGATPDGRHALLPVSEGISPVQGTDRLGPTAVVRSASKMDHARTGGTLLNQKFSPDVLKNDADLKKLAQLVRGYFALGGHHIQFNVVTADLLRRAQGDPEGHRDLIVRVAGYSDYFCDLTKPLQDEIISRTEHKAFS